MWTTDRLLFVPVPKSATHTISRVLREQLGAHKVPGHTHRPPTPAEMEGREVVWSVRVDPLAWYRSVWHHALQGARTRAFLAEWIGVGRVRFEARYDDDAWRARAMWEWIARASLGQPVHEPGEWSVLAHKMPPAPGRPLYDALAEWQTSPTWNAESPTAVLTVIEDGRIDGLRDLVARHGGDPDFAMPWENRGDYRQPETAVG